LNHTVEKKPLYRRNDEPRVWYKLMNTDMPVIIPVEGNLMINISYLIRNNLKKSLDYIESCNIGLCKHLANREKKHKLYYSV